MESGLPLVASYKKEKYKKKLPQSQIYFGKFFAWQREAIGGTPKVKDFGEWEPSAGAEPGTGLNLCNKVHLQAGKAWKG